MTRFSLYFRLPQFYLLKLSTLKIGLAGAFLILIIGILGWFGEDIFQNFVHQNFPFQAAVVENLTSTEEKSTPPEIQPEEKAVAPSKEKIEAEKKEHPSVLQEEETFAQPLGRGGPEISLIEIQDEIDDIAERIDVLSREIIELVEESQPSPEEIQEKGEKPEEIEEIEEIEEEKEEDEEVKEKLEEEKAGQEVGQKFCDKMTVDDPSRNKIIINEVAWMGSASSANEEWIELKNISASHIDLSGWQILDKQDQIRIIFGAGDWVPGNSFYLLERTDDNSVPNILADFIYTGALNDKEEALFLFDENCQLQDKVEALPNWPAGNKEERRTMERGEDFSWHTYQGVAQGGILGTPKRKNSQPVIFSPGGGGGPGPSEPIFCSQENLAEPAYQPVIFNEIAWMGTSIDWRDEWLELKNISETDVSLEGWQILDKDNQIKIIFGNGELFSASGLYLLERTNDDSVPHILADKIYTGDLKDQDESLRLFDQNCNLIDEVLANPDWPAGNKEERRSMERASDFNWQTYYGQGENEIMGTPKKENSQRPEPKDETPPLVSFEDIFSLKIDPIFTISWQGEDPIGTTTPSGLETFYLQYSILENASPSNLDGIQYQDENENWQNWSEAEILEIGGEQNQLTILGEDGESYYFQIQVKDKAGNESDWSEISIKISLPKILLINEVYYNVGKDKGEEGDNEWIEIYNPNEISVDISGWIIEDNGGPSRQTTIPDSTQVPAKGFALITPNEATWTYWVIPEETTKVILGKKIGSYGLSNEGDRVILKNSNGEEVDAMSYGNDSTIFNLPGVTKEGHSLARQIAGYDTNQASDWQVLEFPTPGQ